MTLCSDDAATGGDGRLRPRPEPTDWVAMLLVVGILLGLVLTLGWVGVLAWLAVRLAAWLLA